MISSRAFLKCDFLLVSSKLLHAKCNVGSRETKFSEHNQRETNTMRLLTVLTESNVVTRQPLHLGMLEQGSTVVFKDVHGLRTLKRLSVVWYNQSLLFRPTAQFHPFTKFVLYECTFKFYRMLYFPGVFPRKTWVFLYIITWAPCMCYGTV